MAQLLALIAGVVLGGVAEVVGSNLARGKIFTASICSVDSLYPSVCIYYINITFPARVIVENIIPRNVIINRGAAEVDNHISRDDIFDYYPSRQCNIYFIIPDRTLDPLLFSEVLLLLNIPIMVRGDPKGKLE